MHIDRTASAEYPAREHAPCFRIAHTPDVFDALNESSVSLAVWRRAVPQETSLALERWAVHHAKPFSAVVSSASCDVSVVLAGMHKGRLHSWLQHDLATLFGQFVTASGAGRLRVFFGPVVTDQCRKFHVDYTRLRLITTYTGPGTQWIADEDVNRAAVGAASGPAERANRAILKAGGVVHRARVGDVLMMKGVAYGGGCLGAVHRSPPLKATGARRVVLIVSTLEPV